MTDPLTRQEFNPLAYVPVLLLIGSIAGVWATLQTDINDTSRRLDAVEARAGKLEASVEANDVRIRLLETGFGRMEERLVAIGEGVLRIGRRLGGQP